MTGKNVYTMTAMTRRAFVGLAVMAAQAGLAGCVRNGAPDAGSSDGGAGKSGDAGTSSPFAPQQSAQASVDGILIDRVTIEEGTGPDGKPFRYIRVAYTFENVTDSTLSHPIPTSTHTRTGSSSTGPTRCRTSGRRSRSSRAGN